MEGGREGGRECFHSEEQRLVGATQVAKGGRQGGKEIKREGGRKGGRHLDKAVDDAAFQELLHNGG